MTSDINESLTYLLIWDQFLIS